MKIANKVKLSGLAAALLVSLCSAQAFAAKPGYLDQPTTDSVVRSNYNECWHTAYFDKATEGLVECGDAQPKAVAAAPVVPVPAPAITQEKVVLNANVLFDFNKATLRKEGKGELDALVEKIRGKSGQLKAVEVEGYTDFIGSDKYNLALSDKRAHAVRNFLVAQGISADKVTAVGKGKADAKMTDSCKAKYTMAKHRKALIACIAPDRRVEVTINAVKTVEQQ